MYNYLLTFYNRNWSPHRQTAPLTLEDHKRISYSHVCLQISLEHTCFPLQRNFSSNLHISICFMTVRVSRKRFRGHCGECTGCQQPNCGTYTECLDKKCFGGPGTKKKACRNTCHSSYPHTKRCSNNIKALFSCTWIWWECASKYMYHCTYTPTTQVRCTYMYIQCIYFDSSHTL